MHSGSFDDSSRSGRNPPNPPFAKGGLSFLSIPTTCFTLLRVTVGKTAQADNEKVPPNILSLSEDANQIQLRH